MSYALKGGRMRLTEICLSLMLIPFFTPAAFDGWKGIVPLRSTRSEVEYQLGKPVATCEYTCTYETPNERVSIVYSTDPCGLGDQKSLAGYGRHCSYGNCIPDRETKVKGSETEPQEV